MLHTHSYFHDKRHKTWDDLLKHGSGAPKHRRYELIKSSNGRQWVGDIGCYSPSAKKSKRYFNKQIRHVPLDETDTLMYGKYHKIAARKITSNMYD